MDIEGSISQVKSLLCFPIRENGETVGVFNLSRSKKAAFSEYDRMAILYISTQMGAILSSTRYAAEIREMHKSKQGERTRKTIAAKNHDLIHEAPPDRGEIITGKELPIKTQYPHEAPESNGSFIFFGQKMDRIREVIDQVANTDVTILIQGESV